MHPRPFHGCAHAATATPPSSMQQRERERESERRERPRVWYQPVSHRGWNKHTQDGGLCHTQDGGLCHTEDERVRGAERGRGVNKVAPPARFQAVHMLQPPPRLPPCNRERERERERERDHVCGTGLCHTPVPLCHTEDGISTHRMEACLTQDGTGLCQDVSHRKEQAHTGWRKHTQGGGST